MSRESLPISPAAFTEAIKDLSLPSIYAKAAELTNSVAHLHRSNAELHAFVSESCETEAEKQELQGYIAENEGVVGAMNERIRLLKAEVEGRGQRWIELDVGESEDGALDGEGSSEAAIQPAPTVNGNGVGAVPPGDRVSGQDSAGGGGGGGEDEDGVYL